MWDNIRVIYSVWMRWNRHDLCLAIESIRICSVTHIFFYYNFLQYDSYGDFQYFVGTNFDSSKTTRFEVSFFSIVSIRICADNVRVKWIIALFTIYFSETPKSIPNFDGILATTKENQILGLSSMENPPVSANKTKYIHQIWCDRKVPETVVMNQMEIIDWEYSDIHDDDEKEADNGAHAKLLCTGDECLQYKQPISPVVFIKQDDISSQKTTTL